MSKFQIRILLSSSIVALLGGSFSANPVSASETPPAPLQVNEVVSTPLSFVGMTDLGGFRIVKATAVLSSTEQTTIRMSFPAGTSDRAVKVQLVSKSTIPSSHQTLFTLKISGIDLWNLAPADLTNAQSLEIAHQALFAHGKSGRGEHWTPVSAMPAKGLQAGKLSGYQVLADGSILIQFKKSNSYSKLVTTLL